MVLIRLHFISVRGKFTKNHSQNKIHSPDNLQPLGEYKGMLFMILPSQVYRENLFHRSYTRNMLGVGRKRNVDKTGCLYVMVPNKIHSKHLSKCYYIFSILLPSISKKKYDHNLDIFLFIEKLSV